MLTFTETTDHGWSPLPKHYAIAVLPFGLATTCYEFCTNNIKGGLVERSSR